jgi:hypothetical protein
VAEQAKLEIFKTNSEKQSIARSTKEGSHQAGCLVPRSLKRDVESADVVWMYPVNK